MIIADDVRQSLNHISYGAPAAFKESILVKYSAMNRSFITSEIYRLGSLVADPVTLGKIYAVLFFAISGTVFFFVGREIGGGYAGVLSWFLFVFVFGSFRYSIGGFDHGFMRPFVALTIYGVYKQKWKFFIPLMLFEVLIYPMAGILTGFVLVGDILVHDLKTLGQKYFWKHKGLPLLFAAGLALVPILSKYALTPDWYGHFVTRADIGTRIEFTNEGRYPIVPVRGLFYVLRAHFHSYMIWLSLCFFLIVNGKNTWKLPRGLATVLFMSLLCYELADILLLRLYIPDRYVKYPLPVFLIFFLGVNYSWFLKSVQPGKKQIASLMLIIATVMVIRHASFDYNRYTMKVSHPEILVFLKSLPEDALIAAPPYLADDIPVFSRRRVLFNYELSHPWVTGYWRIIRERTRDFYKGYFAEDPESVLAVSDKYHITHWVIQREDYEKSNRQNKKYYFEPFQDEIKRMITNRNNFVFQNISEDKIAYEDSVYSVISTSALKR